ncbi:hypothetical protein Tco_0963271 [Tanacetum coccineum]
MLAGLCWRDIINEVREVEDSMVLTMRDFMYIKCGNGVSTNAGTIFGLAASLLKLYFPVVMLFIRGGNRAVSVHKELTGIGHSSCLIRVLLDGSVF